jgi:hypothetical protein
MRRRLLAAVGVVVLVGLAGCSVFGPGEPDPQQLQQNATYDWETEAGASYNVTRTQYQAVVDLNGSALVGADRNENATELRLYRRDSVGSEQPVDVAALKFRYPNGTVVGAEAFTVERTRSRTLVRPPQTTGQVAYTASRPTGKRFSVPVVQEGSQAVTLPARTRVGIPLLSQVSPPADCKTVTANRMTIHWESVDGGTLIARYYLQRDLLLFGGLFAVLGVVGVGGALYYLRQIRLLERRREEVGLDVETEDDDLDDGGPPPGMR